MEKIRPPSLTFFTPSNPSKIMISLLENNGVVVVVVVPSDDSVNEFEEFECRWKTFESTIPSYCWHFRYFVAVARQSFTLDSYSFLLLYYIFLIVLALFILLQPIAPMRQSQQLDCSMCFFFSFSFAFLQLTCSVYNCN